MLFLVLNLGDGSHVEGQLKGSISACGGECSERSGALRGGRGGFIVQWAYLDEGILKRRLQQEFDGTVKLLAYKDWYGGLHRLLADYVRKTALRCKVIEDLDIISWKLLSYPQRLTVTHQLGMGFPPRSTSHTRIDADRNGIKSGRRSIQKIPIDIDFPSTVSSSWVLVIVGRALSLHDLTEVLCKYSR